MPPDEPREPYSPQAEAFIRALKGDGTPASERSGARCTEFLNSLQLDASTYAQLLKSRGNEAASLTAYDFVEQHLEQFQPRDPLERMLAVQILWQHLRIFELCVRETLTNDVKQLAALRTATEKAMNTFRRQAQAMRDLKIPRSRNLISGGQVNVGDGQVVTNNQINAGSTSANELGCDDAEQATISVDASRSSEPAGLRSAREALDAVNGATDRNGEAVVESKRSEARAPRRRRAAG